jgi:hypothetical protein
MCENDARDSDSGDQPNFEAKVAKWLKDSGYSLEMAVAQAMQKAGFGVVQSEYFEDSDTSKWRETDVIGYCEHQSDTCRAIFSFIVECKSGNKPWVIFTSSDGYPWELAAVRRAASDAGQSILTSLSFNSTVKASPLFEVPQRPGYGLTVALRDSEKSDATYDALNSVCKAALGQIKRIDAVPHERLITFVWPTIVINVPLFESYLDESGEPQVNQIKKGTLIWKNPMITRHTIVQIYTAEQFLFECPALFSAAGEFVKLAAAENDRSPRD